MVEAGGLVDDGVVGGARSLPTRDVVSLWVGIGVSVEAEEVL